MMQGSIGGEQPVGAKQMRAFEGLVHSTARMFAAQVKREEEDLAQELRIIVWRAIRAYDPTRSKLSLERYVFGAITNKIRDYKRDAARERDRRVRHEITFLHIEDMHVRGSDDSAPNRNQQEAFDSLFNYVEREHVYGRIEGEMFELPSTVTEAEANVLVLLMMELRKPEIVLRLGFSREQVDACIASLREKFADWKPSSRHASTALAVRVEAELVGSRAA